MFVKNKFSTKKKNVTILIKNFFANLVYCSEFIRLTDLLPEGYPRAARVTPTTVPLRSLI